VLVDTSGMTLQVPFSESDISKLKVGQPATVTVNALPGSELAAHVASIATLPTTNGGVVSYNVTFDLDQLEHGLRPGMTASAQVVVSQAQGAVSVPTAAISRAGGSQAVTVVRGGKQVQQPVLTGITGDTTTQVVSGLQAGERVVITTASNLGTTGAAGVGRAGFGGLGAGAGLGGGGLGGGGLGGAGGGGGGLRGAGGGAAGGGGGAAGGGGTGG
jgi:macrolide-specific efflux system membrane fusion protein